MSSTEKKKLAKERGKKSASKQGKGVGSRKKFSLPAKWREETQKRAGKKRLQFSSPGKTKYTTQKAVKESLEARDMPEFLHENDRNCFSLNLDPVVKTSRWTSSKFKLIKWEKRWNIGCLSVSQHSLWKWCSKSTKHLNVELPIATVRVNYFGLAVLYNRIFDLHSQYVLLVTNVICKRNLVCSAFRT